MSLIKQCITPKPQQNGEFNELVNQGTNELLNDAVQGFNTYHFAFPIRLVSVKFHHS